MTQSGQVSSWVPIFVGVLGIIGVVVGQLISSRKDDRRWKREMLREDKRWERETQREERRLAVEKDVETTRRLNVARLEWRKERLAAYTAYLSAIRAFDQAYGVEYLIFDSVSRRAGNSDDRARLRAVEDAALEMSMLAGMEVREYGDNLLNTVRAIFRNFNGVVLDKADSGEVESRLVRGMFENLSLQRTQFLDVVRSELAVDIT